MTSRAPASGPRIGVLGSSVTRDAFTLEEAQRFELVAYLARTALGSLMGRRTQMISPDFSTITSGFQRRVVQDDVVKQGRVRLRALDVDALVIDLIDERLPIARFDDGGTATVSTEFRKLGVPLALYTKIPSHGPEAFDLWRSGWTTLLTLLDQIGARHKVVIHRAHWVVRAADGRRTVDDPETVFVANRWLDAAYEHMALSLEPHQVIEVPSRQVFADPLHPRGCNPSTSRPSTTRRSSVSSRSSSNGRAEPTRPRWIPAAP